MSLKRDDTKKRILEVTMDLLESTENPDDVTVRRIAEAAGIGTGLINYHFNSRDNLVKEAVTGKMESLAEIIEKLDGDSSNPKKYLEETLIAMSDTAMKNHKLNKLSVEYDLLKGDFRIYLYLIPVLKKIYNESKSETDLRLISFQLIVTMQSIYLRQEAFHMLTGINIELKSERDSLIKSIVQNLIK